MNDKQQMHYLLVGYPFSGKTTLAKKLEEKFGFVRLNIDDIKFEKGFEGVSDAGVLDEAWVEIFKEIDKRLENYLREGKTVLNENAWMKKEWRNGKRKIAYDLGVDTKVIYITTSEEIVRKRRQENQKTQERFHVPDDMFEEAIRDFEPPTEEENVILYNQDTDFDLWIKENF